MVGSNQPTATHAPHGILSDLDAMLPPGKAGAKHLSQTE